MGKKGGSIVGIVVILLFILLSLNPITIDFSDIEAQVKVLEVGTRYAFLNIGEQKYIRVQNAFSSQYTSSSEVWETCISSKDYAIFREAQKSKDTINIHVKGNKISTIFTCTTGDKVVDVTRK